eukprot:6895156-Prymnesium_polylepis.1
MASPHVRGSTLPHLVHILADDLGWADVGWHRASNDTDVQTPTLDSLVREGVELDRFCNAAVALELTLQPPRYCMQRAPPLAALQTRTRSARRRGAPCRRAGMRST